MFRKDLSFGRVLLASLVVVSFAGCNSIRKMTANGGVEFIVQLQTAKQNKEELFRKAIGRMRSVGDYFGPTDIEPVPDSPDEFVVKVYAKENVEKMKKAMFTNYILELRKVVSRPYPAITMYLTEQEAKNALNSEQIILPYQEYAQEKPKFVILEERIIVSGEDVKTAGAVASFDDENYSISFTLKPEGATKFGDWTMRNINNYMAVVLNKKVISIAYIKSQITDMGQIDGNFTEETAKELASSLQGGTLPVTYTVISEKVF